MIFLPDTEASVVLLVSWLPSPPLVYLKEKISADQFPILDLKCLCNTVDYGVIKNRIARYFIELQTHNKRIPIQPT